MTTIQMEAKTFFTTESGGEFLFTDNSSVRLTDQFNTNYKVSDFTLFVSKEDGMAVRNRISKGRGRIVLRKVDTAEELHLLAKDDEGFYSERKINYSFEPKEGLSPIHFFGSQLKGDLLIPESPIAGTTIVEVLTEAVPAYC